MRISKANNLAYLMVIGGFLSFWFLRTALGSDDDDVYLKKIITCGLQNQLSKCVRKYIDSF
jgi:hypothetical protein